MNTPNRIEREKGCEVRPQPFRKNYRQLRKAGSGRGGLFQGRAHRLVVQFHTKSRQTGSILQTEYRWMDGWIDR